MWISAETIRPTATDLPPRPRCRRTLLVLAVIAAGALRAAWALRHGLAIEQEGVEYARIAENLLAGHGYVGIFNNGTQLNFPPLYPIMIAAVSLLTGNTEWAARAINIVCGAALVIPMFKIAERLYGRRAANAVAALVVFHPVLIAAAASTYVEGPYLTVMMFAVFWLTRWVTDRRLGASLTSGALFGFAYLLRPEAFLIAGVFAACGLGAAVFAKERRATWVGALALAGAFALVAAPNVAFLTRSSGKFRIEAKGTLAYAWGQRMNAGMSYTEAANGIGQDLSDQGVFMRPNLDIINSTSYTTREYLVYVLKAARHNARIIIDTIADRPSFGSPWLFALVVLGLLRSVWDRHRTLFDGILVVTATMFVLVLLTVQALWFRYFFTLLGMLLFWAGKGAEELYGWARDTLTAVSGSPRAGHLAGQTLKWASILVVLGYSFRALPGEVQFAESLNWERARAGRWLAQQEPASKWVMGAGLQVCVLRRRGPDLPSVRRLRSRSALRRKAEARLHRPAGTSEGRAPRIRPDGSTKASQTSGRPSSTTRAPPRTSASRSTGGPIHRYCVAVALTGVVQPQGAPGAPPQANGRHSTPSLSATVKSGAGFWLRRLTTLSLRNSSRRPRASASLSAPQTNLGGVRMNTGVRSRRCPISASSARIDEGRGCATVIGTGTVGTAPVQQRAIIAATSSWWTRN